jgi:tetratricopeptide (TPR) repeat protein
MTAQKAKLTRKEIKGPDEFQNVMARVVEFFRDYGTWVLAGMAVVLLAIVGGVMLSRHSDNRTIAVAADFDRAFAPVAAVGLAVESREAGEDAEKAKKALDESKARLAGARGDLDKFAAAHGDSPLARLAMLARGAAAAASGDAATAMQSYGAFLTADPGATFAFVAWESLGNAADAAGKRDEAERAYNEMAKSQSSLARAWAWLHLGDLYNAATRLKADETSDPAKARDYYQKGEKECGGEETLMPPIQLLAKKTIQARLLTVR